MNELRGFALWRDQLFDACREFAASMAYDVKIASWSDIEQVNVRIINLRNCKWQSFDFEYLDSADRDICKVMGFIVYKCITTIYDAKYDAQYLATYLENTGLVLRGCLTTDINVADLYPKRMVVVSSRGTGRSDVMDSLRYAVSVWEQHKVQNQMTYYTPEIKDVMFEAPATIVFWADGTKTVVKAKGEPYDPEKGLAMAISRKALGNEYEYYNIFKKWLKKAKTEAKSQVVHDEHPVCDGVCELCCPVKTNGKGLVGSGCKHCNAYKNHCTDK